ncbi:alanine racemase [Spirochaetia bacterium]|nr:alanine racemase [Spirochaetia bacterium]
MRATKAIIHLDALRRNIQLIRGRLGQTRLCVPVKADAYGHGAVPVARAALEAGAAFLAVATVGEGTELRSANITAPILLLSVPLPEELPELVASRLVPFVADNDFAAELNAVAGRTSSAKFDVHLKIDTGMGRIGCLPEKAASVAAFIQKQSALRLAGTATHLARADSTAEQDISYTKEQIAVFCGAVDTIRSAGIDPGIVHAANSGAVLLHRDAWFDMARPGILVYGYDTVDSGFPVEPLMELVTRIVFIKPVKKGEAVSYGGIWTAPQDTVIATIPVGYGDGLPRALSGKLRVSINGKTYSQVGRICMDQCMIDLGPGAAADQIKRWENVTVFSSAAIPATLTGTIPYEIACGINKRVPRIYEA